MRVLDDEQLVGPLQQLVDRRAHRALDELDEPLRVDALARADEERALAALVVGRDRDELEDPLDVAGLEARLEQPLRRAAADEPLRAGAGVDPDRLDADDAAHAVARRGGDPDQRHHLLRRELRHRRRALVRVARADPHLGEQRVLPLDDPRRDVLREILDRGTRRPRRRPRSPPRRAPGSATCGRPSATDRGRPCSRSSPRSASRARRGRSSPPSGRRHAGAREAERHLGRRGLEIVEQVRVVSVTPVLCLTAVSDDTYFARLVSLACHDVRTPLATVHGFAKTLERDGGARAAGRPLRRDDRRGVGADGRAARRALARGADRVAAATSRCSREADTLELAQAARGAARRGSRAGHAARARRSRPTRTPSTAASRRSCSRRSATAGSTRSRRRARRRDRRVTGHAGIGAGRARRGPARSRRGRRGAARSPRSAARSRSTARR